MSLDNEVKRKNCLLVFRNKKLNVFDGAHSVIKSFADGGYWFDKISYIAYDSNEEVAGALKDGYTAYDNIVVLCPETMSGAIKDFLSKLYGTPFGDFGRLSAGACDVFILYSDGRNRLMVSDIVSALDKKYCAKSYNTLIKTVGAPAEVVKSALKEAKDICGEMEFNVRDFHGDCAIEIIYARTTPKVSFDTAYRAALTKLNDYVYAIENITLEEQLFRLLKLRRMKLSVAESFTGGGITHRLVSVPGMSEVLFEGLNTYSNEAKMQRLGVKEMTLSHYGAVSEQTAYEMADGLLKTGNCDFSIATTGIAGPKSDNTKKPVGLCYIAVGSREKISVFKYNLKGGREDVTETAINLAMFLAYKTLK